MSARPRSNSFHYTLRGVVGPLTAPGFAGCPVRRAGPANWRRGRAIFLRRDERVAAYATDTGDFSDAQLEAVQHREGQVYLDVSEKPAPDDFTTDLRKLERSAVCAGCDAAAGCAGLFDPSPDEVFARDDAAVEAMVAALRGDVLDVGCGQGPYGATLGALAARGDIAYVGLDPDDAHIAGLRARWPWATLRVGTAEALDPAAERFDHALLLRSWNHLADPARVAASLARMLRPGGTLLVVDNVAFGLVRSRRQAARAEAGPAGFEHYRNDGAAEAVATIAPTGLALLDRWDVGPSTSNQWWVRWRKD
jgi:SAM-dependent methyltransferase